MGISEILMILLVALIVLGPAKCIRLARDAGNMIGTLRRSMSDLSRAVEVESLDVKNPDADESGHTDPTKQTGD